MIPLECIKFWLMMQRSCALQYYGGSAPYYNYWGGYGMPGYGQMPPAAPYGMPYYGGYPPAPYGWILTLLLLFVLMWHYTPKDKLWGAVWQNGLIWIWQRKKGNVHFWRKGHSMFKVKMKIKYSNVLGWWYLSNFIMSSFFWYKISITVTGTVLQLLLHHFAAKVTMYDNLWLGWTRNLDCWVWTWYHSSLWSANCTSFGWLYALLCWKCGALQVNSCFKPHFLVVVELLQSIPCTICC